MEHKQLISCAVTEQLISVFVDKKSSFLVMLIKLCDTITENIFKGFKFLAKSDILLSMS